MALSQVNKAYFFFSFHHINFLVEIIQYFQKKNKLIVIEVVWHMAVIRRKKRTPN